jgi:murein DD-endopeptidase MepM/ murein hydrolase activator NlpD
MRIALVTLSSLAILAACAGTTSDDAEPFDDLLAEDLASQSCRPSRDRTASTVGALPFQKLDRGALPTATAAIEWGYPTDRNEMPNNFGIGRSYNEGHEGADLGGAKNKTVVRAAAAGTVVYVLASCPDNDVRNDQVCGNGWGNHVVIRHEVGNLHTRYAHIHPGTLPKEITPGARVAKGATLGKVGHSGLSTGPHLHFELGVRAQAFNPCAPPQNFDVVFNPAKLRYGSTASASAFPRGCRVVPEIANVRATPAGEIVNKLSKGASVVARSTKDGWYAVTFRLGGKDWGTSPAVYMAPSVLSCQ